MFTPNADCTHCVTSTDHTPAQHEKSVAWSQALSRDLELARRAPAPRPSSVYPTRRGYGAYL